MKTNPVEQMNERLSEKSNLERQIEQKSYNSKNTYSPISQKNYTHSKIQTPSSNTSLNSEARNTIKDFHVGNVNEYSLKVNIQVFKLIFLE